MKRRENKSEVPQIIVDSPTHSKHQNVAKEISLHSKKHKSLVEETNGLRTAYMLEIRKLNEQIRSSEKALLEFKDKGDRKEKRRI